MDVLMLQSLSVIEKERPERSYEFLRHYHGIQDCLYSLNFSRQASKLDIPSYTNR